MQIKTLSLVQVNFRQGPKELEAYYLPYTAGTLWSYASSVNEISKTWSLKEMVWKRSLIDEVYKSLADNDLVGFSSYVWNRNYNYELARRIKTYNPKCLIVFGGPDLPITDPFVFEKLPFIDRIVKNEGELIFSNLLSSEDVDHENIEGLLINRDGNAISTGNGQRIDDLSNIPSPYLSGLFDALIENNPSVTWNATLETNRGCPYQCTFCDWGSLTYSKVKKLDLDRVYGEIEWIGRNRCDWMSITDANFGMFAERDSAIVDKIIETQSTYGYPRRVALSWAKNQKSTVVDLAKRLTTNGFNNGLTLSVQSLDDRVLKNIKRRNLETNKIAEVFDLCNKKGVTVNTELILGLPGETVETWKRNVWDLLEINQHNGIEFFQAQLLENAEMNVSQKAEHELETTTVYDYLSGADTDDGIGEGVDVVIRTKDLSSDDMLACQEFQWFMNTWHINGLSQWHSRLLHRHLGESYESFYDGFKQYLEGESWWVSEKKEVLDAYTNWMESGRISMPPIGKVNIHGWNLIHLTNLRMHANNRYNIFHDAVDGYVSHRYGNDVEGCMLDGISRFSRAYVIDYPSIGLYPIDIDIGFNALGYVMGDALRFGDFTHRFSFPEDQSMDLSVFMQNIYYARRRNFGKAQVAHT